MVGRFAVPVNAVSSFTRHCAKQQWKSFSSQSSSPNLNSFNQPSLTQPLPGLPTAVFSSLKEEHETCKVTTLSNGLRVASENRFGQFCTVGVAIVSGSRFEVAYPSGISHFLEKLAFNSTTEYPNRDKILHSLEKHGGICDCQSSRDTMVYAASADSRGLDAVVKILGEVVLRPQISLDEVEIARQAIQFELEALMTKPEQELILMDMIHGAAYRKNTLGLPKICPKSNLSRIDRSILLTYLKHHHTPERMVVAGVGVDHDTLVRSVKRYFIEEAPIWEMDSGLVLPSDTLKVDNSSAQYVGGIVQEECDIPLHAGPSGLPELAHVVIGLESCSHQDQDFVPTCVLNMMMGGGGSFSAGGPGKGMYSRLYTNVLNRYHWMFSAVAYNHSYADTGLFCIHASATPTHVRDIVEVLVKEIVSMSTSISTSEFRRAKTQLQSMLLMNLEARPVVFEDIARQVLATGYRKKKEEFIESIENVTISDIERVTQRLLRSQPAVAARGAIQKMPSLGEIHQGLLDKDGTMQRRSRLLR